MAAQTAGAPAAAAVAEGMPSGPDIDPGWYPGQLETAEEELAPEGDASALKPAVVHHAQAGSSSVPSVMQKVGWGCGPGCRHWH